MLNMRRLESSSLAGSLLSLSGERGRGESSLSALGRRAVRACVVRCALLGWRARRPACRRRCLHRVGGVDLVASLCSRSRSRRREYIKHAIHFCLLILRLWARSKAWNRLQIMRIGQLVASR
jgi:hypothetical protein